MASPVSWRNLTRLCLKSHMVRMVSVRSKMNVSKLTLSCRWLSSASFSVASSSIPSPSAFSTDAASSSIQSSSMVLGAPASPQRLGRRRSSVQDAAAAADSRPPLCHDTAPRNQQLSRAEAENHPVFADRWVQPFKGTPHRRPPSVYTSNQICCSPA